MNDILFKIFGEMSDGIIATDAEGKVLFINSCAETLTGWRLEQAKGQPVENVFDATHDSTGVEIINPVYEAIRTGNSSEMSNHTVLKKINGDETSIEKCGIPIKGENEEIIGTILILRKCGKNDSSAELGLDPNSFSKRLVTELNSLISSISEEITLFKSAGWPGAGRLETLDDMLSKSFYVVKLLADNLSQSNFQKNAWSAKSCAKSAPKPFPEQKDKKLGHILVMDDDQMLRDLAIRCLIRLGYNVTTVADGEEALHVYRYFFGPRSFDAVIVDLTIKNGMGGLQTLQGLQEINPNVKAIITSGYTNDPILKHYEDYGFSEAMYKPFGLFDLDRTLNKVLS